MFVYDQLLRLLFLLIVTVTASASVNAWLKALVSEHLNISSLVDAEWVFCLMQCFILWLLQAWEKTEVV